MTVFLSQLAKRVHTMECIAVKKYKHRMDAYETQTDIDETEIEGVCPLCDIAVTEAQKQYKEAALDIFDRYITLKQSPNPNDNLTTKDLHDSLRSLISQCENKLQASGYLEDRTGMSVKKPSHWKQEKPANSQKAFYSLLFDASVVNIVFDIVYFDRTSCGSIEEYIDEYGHGGEGTQTCENVAKTYAWVESNTDLNHPSQLNDYLADFTGSQPLHQTTNTDSKQETETQEDMTGEVPQPNQQHNADQTSQYEEKEKTGGKTQKGAKNGESEQLTLDAL